MKIAISGLSGCGNTTVSRLVAKKLGLTQFNYTNRDLAKERGITFQEMYELVEKSEEIDLEVDGKLASYAAENNDFVLAARMPIWLDDETVLKKLGLVKKPSFDLKVWLDAPLEMRAKRIVQREGKTLAQVVTETAERDLANAKRFKKIYGINVSEHGFAFVIDTEKLTAEQVAEIISKKVV